MMANPQKVTAHLHPLTRLGSVHLTVSDLGRGLEFYQRMLGLRVHRQEADTAALGAGENDLVVLTEIPGAVRQPRTTGLYHFALLVPSRLDLAQVLRNLLEKGAHLDGASDHLVSEALYLSDPDGNGIEIYRDRPRQHWQFTGHQIRMTVDPLDWEGVLAELGRADVQWSGMAAGTRLGHMHLHVADLQAAVSFYTRAIGFELTLSYGNSAAFLSAGGYHHHLGVNTWNGVGAPPPPPCSIGLRYFTVVLPETDELSRLIDRLEGASVSYETSGAGIFVEDPSQNRLFFTVSESPVK